MKPICLTLIVLILSLSFGIAQDVQRQPGDQVIGSALIIRSVPGYLETIGARDPIEARIVMGTWLPPVAGDSIRYNDTLTAHWNVMSADSNGWFHHEALSGGYVYLGLNAAREETILLEGMGHAMVYVNGSPRSGNPYEEKDRWESWEPHFDYSLLPVQLHKGLNTFLFQCSRDVLKVKIHHPGAGVMFNTHDVTVPDLIADSSYDTWGAIVVINATDVAVEGLEILATFDGGRTDRTPVPAILPMSVRKIPFRIAGKASQAHANVGYRLYLRDQRDEGMLDSALIKIRVVGPLDNRKETFISGVDGSVQYYSLRPARPSSGDLPPALFLSLHGASVEAINQTASYVPKRWGYIVAPTNRRPYGYNWEDWGRTDAIEVLDLVSQKFEIDKDRVYLTGHSMGGHGVYHIGSLFPDRFAAIGPSAGWISFWTYRVREAFEHPSPIREMIQRATLPSDTYTMSRNYRQLGVYILHGSVDDNVPVEQSRLMARHLSGFDHDFIYHEQPVAGHWWDASDEPGADCVDWAPMFDYFARHARPGNIRTREIDFAVSNPGISSRDYWIGIEAQTQQLKLSTIAAHLDPELRRYICSTANVERFSIDASGLPPGLPVIAVVDSQKITNIPWPHEGTTIWLERVRGTWTSVPKPPPSIKGPHRYGTFKDAIAHRVQFVYGTKGTKEENSWAFEKARFDAERFWYQGNGSIDVIADEDFHPSAEPDRNVVLYGNEQTNGAWKSLLSDSPVMVREGLVQIGKHIFRGNDLSCLFIRPRPKSDIASVGVVSGSGLTGMRLNTKMAYLTPGIGFPDCLVSKADVLMKGEESLLAAGFFGLDWSVEGGEFVWNER